MHLRPQDKDFEVKILKVTNSRPVKFKGIQLTYCGTSHNNAHPDYSGVVGRWRDYTVYLTSGGNLLLEREDLTCWQGEEDRRFTTLFKSEDQLKGLFDKMEHIGKAEKILMTALEGLGIDLSKDLDETAEV
jgi:hypothetical protein